MNAIVIYTIKYLAFSTIVFVILLFYWMRQHKPILWPGLQYGFMQTIWFLYAKDMPARGVYEFFMHGHVFVLLFCVELRRNSVEIVLDLLSKKIYSGYKFSIMRGIFQFPVYFCWKLTNDWSKWCKNLLISVRSIMRKSTLTLLCFFAQEKS